MKYENSIRTLINLGYKEEDIEKIVDAYPLNNMRDDTLSKNIKNNGTYVGNPAKKIQY